MTTTTFVPTLQEALDRGSLTDIADICRLVRLGRILSVVKVTFSGLTSATSFDITASATLAKGTVSGVTIFSSETLPAIASIATLRVTAGAAAAGVRQVTDVGGTPSSSVATISDDGKTITFEAGVTGFVITYEPRPLNSTQSSLAVGEPY